MFFDETYVFSPNIPLHICGQISSYVGYKTHPIADIVRSTEFGHKRVELVVRWRVIAHNLRISTFLEEGSANPEDLVGYAQRIYERTARVPRYDPVMMFQGGVPDTTDNLEFH